jgi:Zn-dependent metalloprotease
VTYKDDSGEKVTKHYPSTMEERFVVKDMKACNKKNDNCWVHVNSTIPSHASYLVTKSIGIEKAEKLYYATLMHFLPNRANFRAARKATLSACASLYDEETCMEVRKAFQEVGL